MSAIMLLLTAFLCSLTTGFLFAFAVVVMPGIRGLRDREFLRAFQVIDGIIQNNQPLFMLVWVGSVAMLLASTALLFTGMAGTDRLLLGAGAISYVFGVQLPTFRINVPLNNALQKLTVDTMDDAASLAARNAFEPQWNRWNTIRTGLASLTTGLLLVLLVRL